MAGRPKMTAKKVLALERRALDLAGDMRAASPDMY